MPDITIPPESLEAGARAILKTWCVSPWEIASEQDRLNSFDEARAAFEAMVEAWPGMNAKAATDHVMLLNSTPALILPLTEKPE